LHGALLAQVPVRDTIPRRDTTTKRDTIPKKRDSTTLVIPVPAHADSLLRDSLAKKDSIARQDSLKKAKGDTVRPPLAHSEAPVELSIGRRLHWNRDSLFATGAITLADLLERIPGFTGLHAGWIASPAMSAYMGDMRRVRVFLDGAEYTSLDRRTQGMLDLTQINLWAMEDATIEVAADEIRVYLRSWRVNHRASETRTDVSTGDQQTNMYRGFYGKRLSNGLAVQFAAQQYGTTPPVLFGSSADQTGVVARLGWANTKWSFDGFLSQISRHRGVITRELTEPGDSIPTLNSSRGDAYLRLGYGDPDTSAAWAQAMVVGTKYNYTGLRTLTIQNPLTAADSAFNVSPLDSNAFRTQYVFTVGTVRGPLRLSASDRYFVQAGKTINSPSARASIAFSRLGLSAFYEGKSVDSIERGSVTAQFTPLSFVSLLASAGRTKDERVQDSSYTENYIRAEAGVRIHGLWFLGGIMRRDSTRLSAPKVFDTSFVAIHEPAVTGYTAAIRGKLWRIIGADAWAVRWNDTTGFYRPRYQTRSELYVKTNWLSRFPTNDLGISFSAIHEYRSGVFFPVLSSGTDADQRSIGIAQAPGYRTISTLLEIRILSATVSWQFRNLLGERYTQVPGFAMPRQTNFYGVRWAFVD
jgi:hypothetical protein